VHVSLNDNDPAPLFCGAWSVALTTVEGTHATALSTLLLYTILYCLFRAHKTKQKLLLVTLHVSQVVHLV